jgi:hypothetical protein
MKIFKIKFKGNTLKVVKLAEFDTIDNFTLYTNDREITKRSKWLESFCPGDFVINHPNRIYVRVLSKFWKPSE